MWLQTFKEVFFESVLQLLWRQWSALGVLGQSAYGGPSALDPEALLFSTMRFGRYDPRLFDAAIEWWLKNGEWLSITRLQRFQKELKPVEQRALAAATQAVILQKKAGKWKKLTMYEHPATLQAESLFLLPEGKPLPAVGGADETFLRFGLHRPRFDVRQVSEKVPLGPPANLRIRFRAFFGLSSRAEILLYLLTHDAAHPRRVAKQTHYAFASVSAALRQMNYSGLVSHQRRGREMEYQIDDAKWMRFLDIKRPAVWVNWKVVFDGLNEIWNCLEDLSDRHASESILGSEMRRCARKVNRHLLDSEIERSFSEKERRDTRDYLGVFQSDFSKLFRELDEDLVSARATSRSPTPK